MELINYDCIYVLYSWLDYKSFLRMFMLSKNLNKYNDYLIKNENLHIKLLRSTIYNSETDYSKLNTRDFNITQLHNLGRIQYCDSSINASIGFSYYYLYLYKNKITIQGELVGYNYHIIDKKLAELGNFVKLMYSNDIIFALHENCRIYRINNINFDTDNIDYIIVDSCIISIYNDNNIMNTINKNLVILETKSFNRYYELLYYYDKYKITLDKFGNLMRLDIKLIDSYVIKICLIKHILLILDKYGQLYFINMINNLKILLISDIIDIQKQEEMKYFIITNNSNNIYHTDKIDDCTNEIKIIFNNFF